MRPSSDVDESGMYECQECGARPAEVAGRVCPSCGGPLVDIARERDL